MRLIFVLLSLTLTLFDATTPQPNPIRATCNFLVKKAILPQVTKSMSKIASSGFTALNLQKALKEEGIIMTQKSNLWIIGAKGEDLVGQRFLKTTYTLSAAAAGTTTMGLYLSNYYHPQNESQLQISAEAVSKYFDNIDKLFLESGTIPKSQAKLIKDGDVNSQNFEADKITPLIWAYEKRLATEKAEIANGRAQDGPMIIGNWDYPVQFGYKAAYRKDKSDIKMKFFLNVIQSKPFFYEGTLYSELLPSPNPKHPNGAGAIQTLKGTYDPSNYKWTFYPNVQNDTAKITTKAPIYISFDPYDLDTAHIEYQGYLYLLARW